MESFWDECKELTDNHYCLLKKKKKKSQTERGFTIDFFDMDWTLGIADECIGEAVRSETLPPPHQAIHFAVNDYGTTTTKKVSNLLLIINKTITDVHHFLAVKRRN